MHSPFRYIAQALAIDILLIAAYNIAVKYNGIALQVWAITLLLFTTFAQLAIVSASTVITIKKLQTKPDSDIFNGDLMTMRKNFTSPFVASIAAVLAISNISQPGTFLFSIDSIVSSELTRTNALAIDGRLLHLLFPS